MVEELKLKHFSFVIILANFGCFDQLKMMANLNLRHLELSFTKRFPESLDYFEFGVMPNYYHLSIICY